MNRKMISFALILAMLLSTAIVSLAQPMPNNGPYGPYGPGGSYPSGQGNYYPSGPGNYPSMPGNYPSMPGNYPSMPGNYPSMPGNYPSGPGNMPYQPGQGQGNMPGTGGNQSSSGQGSQGGHPQSGPSSSQPSFTPQASTSNAATNLAQGQKLSEQDVASVGGSVSAGTQSSGGLQTYKLVIGPQLQYWVLYNGQWTKNAAAIFYGQQINTLLYNDQGQYLWSYEQYPNGYVDWQNLGYMYQGYYNFWFLGDAKGWHQTAIWGSNSGWSNVIWIYVW